jgi:DNA-binding response OmpR family regulator
MRGKILIVDDNPGIVELLQRKLDREGYGVVGCVKSDCAMEKILAEIPDLVILDILMPGKSGWDVMEELKSNPDTASIPVIISTVKNRPEDMDAGKDLGAADYIAKPYVFSDLLEKIQGVLGTD